MLILVFLFFAIKVFAVDCNCEVRVYSPMTGSYQAEPIKLKSYELETFSSYSFKNQLRCRMSCEQKFQEDMPTDRLISLLSLYSQELISKKALGFNCTGLTTLKFPVRVKASLGRLGLGNVADTIQVINHEEICF